ncbi:MAG: LamG-like jellyroll fold domain-containing protein, partial [Verrucomicrobiales bacterium]
TYTWRRDGEDVGDMPELILADIQPEQAGDYTVEISNAEGSVTSMVATIVILEPIPGLFNTGVAEDGSLTDDMEPEVHYELIMDPNEEGLEAIVLNSTVFPIVSGPWVPNSETYKWIGVGEDNNGPVGDYLYRLTFDLSAFDPDNVFLEGQWATDNLGGALILNGEDTGIANEAQFTAFTSFRLETGFVSGMNTLEIPVNNAPEGDNPHGLIVANLRGGGQTEDPNLIGPSVTPFGQLDESQAVTVMASIRNSGRTQVLGITEATIVGANSALFTLGEVPAQVQPNETITIEISLDPQGAKGNFDAVLQLTTNDPSTPVAQFDISAFIPVSPNLIAHYKLDETDGDRLIDDSGFGRNGTFNTTQGNLTLGQDPLAAGTAATFAEGAMAEVGPDVFPVFENFTISLWHVPGETNGATSIVSRGDGAGDPFALVGSGTTLLWFTGGSEDPLTLGDALTLGEAHHLVVTVENGLSSVYIDGALVDSAETSAFLDKENNSLQFGAANGILGINGSLDDIQIYNRALTSGEVGDLFTNPGEVVGGGGGNPIADLPALSIRQAGNDIVLAWPGNAEAVQLQSSPDMQGFAPVQEAPISANGESTVTLPRTESSYFRLSRQP